MVLVDTSVWIEASRRDGDLACKVGLENLLEEYEAAWCSAVKLEFMRGKTGTPRNLRIPNAHCENHGSSRKILLLRGLPLATVQTLAATFSPERSLSLPAGVGCQLPGTPGNRDQPGIEKLIQRIRADLPRNWDFPQEARQLGMSYSSLRQKFRLFTGLPPRQFLIRERINLSCRFLMEGLPVQEAGAKAGMPNPYYFSRLFKKVMQMPPRDYRMP